MPKMSTPVADQPVDGSTEAKPLNGKQRKQAKKTDREQAVAKSLKTPAPKKREVIHPKYDVLLFCTDAKKAPGDVANPLELALAKEIIGWQTEEEYKTEWQAVNPGKDVKLCKGFGSDYLLTDKFGNKVRCLRNLHNRPFNTSLANDWMLSILAKSWKQNGETIIVDKYADVQDGQHRLIGFILACQEWELDQQKPKAERKWDTWKQCPVIDALIVCGIEADDDTVNTIGVGKPRTLEDALYRCEWFFKQPIAQRQAMARTTSHAVRFLRWRTVAENENAPKRSHSEAFTFIEQHPRILECVKFIHDEDSGGKIGKMIHLSYATSLLYLMGAAMTSDETYRSEPVEKSVNWELWDKACEFFVDFAANGKVTEALREALMADEVQVASGSFGRDWKSGLVIKAFNQLLDEEAITLEAIQMGIAHNGEGVPTLTEAPSLGGIDIVYAAPEHEAEDESEE